MTSERRSARERFWTVTMCRLQLVLYGVVLEFAVLVLVHDATARWVAGLGICVLFVAGFRAGWIRRLIRAIAAMHFCLVLLLFPVIISELDRLHAPDQLEQAILLFLASLTVPVGAVLFIREPVDPVQPLDLPPGYEMSFAKDRVLTTGQRLFMWLAFTVLLVLVFVGGPFLLLVGSIVLVPIVIGFYFLWETVVSRRKTRPTAPRRVRLHPRMRKPVQQRSHWSVGPSPYEDDRIYED